MEPRFVTFSQSHLLALGVTMLSVLILYFFRVRIKENTRLETVFRISLAILLLGGEISLQYWYVITGSWKIEYGLPLQLCDFSILMSVMMLLLRSYGIFEIVYFTGVGGALVAIITPELWLGFPHFRFYHFFISHAAIILASLFMVFVDEFRPRLISIGKMLIFLNVFGVFVFIVNYFIDANYMFISKPTYNNTFLNHLGPYPWYLFSLEGIALIIAYLLYLPFRLGNK
jgi:hypothetical integral membrane protein (TIGR02206 family)